MIQVLRPRDNGDVVLTAIDGFAATSVHMSIEDMLALAQVLTAESQSLTRFGYQIETHGLVPIAVEGEGRAGAGGGEEAGA